MLVKSVAAFAALTFAANVAAEPMPYQPSMMKTSARALFGIGRRQEVGYQPEQAVCGAGATCAEACGAGYETCSSSDSQVHCFNPTAGEICCPDKSGNSCDAGYYCTADKQGETWCCPEGMDLAACAAAYSVTGGLVSQTPVPTTTSTSSTSTPPPTTTSTSSSTEEDDVTTSTSTGSFVSTPSFPPSSTTKQPNTTTATTTKSPQPTTTNIPEGAGSAIAPAGALALFAAGLAALL